MAEQSSAFERMQQAQNLLVTDLSDEETVMLDPDAASYFGLSETGPAIWREFAQPNDVDGVVASLVERFDATADEIRADVEAFVDDLLTRGLLVTID